MSRLNYLFVLMEFGNKGLTARQIARVIGVKPDRVYWHMLDLKVLGLVVDNNGRPRVYRLSKDFVEKVVFFADLVKRGK